MKRKRTETLAPAIATTLGQLVDAEPALARVLEVKFDKDGGAAVRYHAVKLAKLVSAETKHFYEERNSAIKQLGVEREPTGAERAKLGPDKITEVTTANLPAFRQRTKDLAEINVTIPWGPLTRAMLDPYTEITGKDQIELGPLFELEPEDTPTT